MDFGFAKMLGSVDTGGQVLTRTALGTVNFCAPEVVKASHGTAYGVSCDIWSLGVITFLLLSGELPFDDDNVRRLMNNIITKPIEPYFQRAAWADVSQKAQEFVRQTLNKDPEVRPSASKLKKMIWLRDAIPTLVDEARRCSVLTQFAR